MMTTAGGSATKPAGKGVDMDAVGNISGVPVYEFDLDGLKVEDKPWRKPGMFVMFFIAMICALLILSSAKQANSNSV